jgi:pentatricopeptide repeat protein
VISLCAALKEHDEAWRLLHEMFAAEMQARGSGLPPRRMTLFVRTCVASQPMRWAWHRRA